MKTNSLFSIIKILFYSLIAALLIWIFILLFLGKSIPFTLNFTKGPIVELQRLKLDEEIDALTIKWTAGKVTITRSLDDSIHLVESGPKGLNQDQWLVPQINESTLIIENKQSNRTFWLLSRNNQRYLQLQLPKKQYESFYLEVTSGEYRLTDADVKQLVVDMTSGELLISNTTSDDIQVSLTSGNATLNSMTTNDLELKVTSGDMNFSGGASNRVEADVTSGNMNLNLSLGVPLTLSADITSGKVDLILSEAEGFQIAVDNTTGRFKADSKLVRINDSLYQYLDYSRNYTVDITSGSMNLSLK